MPDASPQSTFPPAGAISPHGHAADASSTEELAHLARMSGTGSNFGQADYVALNTLAVASLVLGMASGLALAINLFLFIPIAGLACGLLAIRKIRHSNGTQGGMGFALAGILLCLMLGGAAGGREARDWFRLRGETQRVAAIIARFGDAARDGQYDFAYDNLMSRDFREHFDRTRFTNTLHTLQIEPDPRRRISSFGHIEWIKWNGESMIVEPIGDSYQRMIALSLIKFHAFPDPNHEYFELDNRDGEWRIQSIPHIFADERVKKQSPTQ